MSLNQLDGLLIIPEGITGIDENGLNGVNLFGVIIPHSMTYIGDFALSFNDNLSSLSFMGTVEEWNSITFGDLFTDFVSFNDIVCLDDTISLW